MEYAVQLNLTKDSSAPVVRLWETLARESISSAMLDLGAQPHISLAVLEDLDPGPLREDIKRFAESTRPLPVILSHAGAFPTTEGVIFLAPAVTQELLEVHARFHRLLDVRRVPCAGQYRPGRWVPHCTVAIGVAPDKIGAATQICIQSQAFGPAVMDGVSLIEFPPVRGIYTFPLRAGSSA